MTKRRLAAIMFTDIVGYTAMMQEDEKKTAKIRARHRQALETFHKQFHGEIIQYYGDGSLSFFTSAIEAVECALAIQKELQEKPKVPLRIGLHVGDIVIDGESIYGDGVNVASRIESLGVPGNILLSDRVHPELKNHNQIATQSLGFFEFKNVKQPIEVFAVTNKGIVVPKRSELQGKLAQKKKSVAVLPFVNMSNDPDYEHFCDGLAEEILNSLVGVDELQVAARTSSFAFKGKNMDVREIGRLLDVSNILEGSVRKSGNQLRITAQLINTLDGYHFFSETFNRAKDPRVTFAVQSEVSKSISTLIKNHLTEKEQPLKANLDITKPLSIPDTIETNDMKRCQHCGYMNNPEKEDCAKCGNPLTNISVKHEKAHDLPKEQDLKKTVLGSPVAQPFLDKQADSLEGNACSKCQYPLRKDESFCPNCGSAVSSKKGSKKTVAIGDFNLGTQLPSFSMESDQGQKSVDFKGEEVVLNRQNLDKDNMTISGEAHAKFVFKNGQWFVSDMSSNKATFIQVNGEVSINDGDMIILGQKIYRFKSNA